MLCVSILTVPLCAATNAELTEQVRRTEVAFAKTMADRNAAGFASFLSKEAVFLSEDHAARGPRQISSEWKGYFEGAQAPFSWRPDQVEVIESGVLAMTSGPVLNPQGKRIGTFHSVWRREAGGKWKIVLDNGCPACRCDNTNK
ncbi:MAG TPA: nuclear transport factor 2 family protein [Bryobacteraceae bacterium]